MKYYLLLTMILAVSIISLAQKNENVQITKDPSANKLNVTIDGKPFTTFLYPDTLEKCVLYPIRAANGTVVTRGYPLNPQPGDPTDHPHHIGLWFNFENVNGLDFWNNSFAIAPEKKKNYGWIKTDRISETRSGSTGVIAYHANWTNQNNDVLLEENTRYEFSGNDHQRFIDRITTLTANTEVKFNDAKDGMLGLRVAHALEIPTKVDRKFTDDKGITTVVKRNADSIANGNYITSEGKMGDSAWSTRAVWCKMFGKMGADSISIVIIDHPQNPNYPTFWHARGYGLFAANPLGEKIFTNGKSEKNLTLKKGDSVTFRYRIVIDNGKQTITKQEIEKISKEFAGRN
jgi:hypothetical protein